MGLAGAMRSGKSAIAERLRDAWGFTVVSFADGLREEVMERMPGTLGALHDREADGRLGPFYQGQCRCSRTVPRAECIRRMVYGSKPYGFRELLQEYGSQVRRADDPDYWVKPWRQRVESHAAGLVSEARVVVPDVRFPNEARAIRDMDTCGCQPCWNGHKDRCRETHPDGPKVRGLLWHVDRPGYDSGSQHVSETALAHWMDWDAEIRNEGSLADLHAKVDGLAQGAA